MCIRKYTYIYIYGHVSFSYLYVFFVRPFAGDCPVTKLLSVNRCRLRRLHFLMLRDLTSCGRGSVVRSALLVRLSASRTDTACQRHAVGELFGQLASKLACWPPWHMGCLAGMLTGSLASVRCKTNVGFQGSKAVGPPGGLPGMQVRRRNVGETYERC